MFDELALRPVEVTKRKRNSFCVADSPEGLCGQARGTSTTSWAEAGSASGNANDGASASRSAAGRERRPEAAEEAGSKGVAAPGGRSGGRLRRPAASGARIRSLRGGPSAVHSMNNAGP